MTKYLWHGSVEKFEKLIPSQATDISGHHESNKKAVYATDLKNLAISFGLKDKNSNSYAHWTKSGEFNGMVVVKGKIRTGKEFYLYKLDSKDFEKCKGVSHQYYSKEEVKPIKVLELKVDDYIHLIRIGDKKDQDCFEKMRNKFYKDKKCLKT